MAEPLPEQLSDEVERQAWLLRRRGYSTYRIADELAKPVEQGGLGVRVHQSTISRALQRVEKVLHDTFIAQAQEIKARQTEQLEHVQEQAMDGWENSKLNAESERTVIKSQGAKVPKDGETGLPDKPGYHLRPDGEETSEEEKAAFLAANGSGSGVLIVTEQTETRDSKGQAGDPRFLDQARGAMRDIREIWGANAPKQTDITSGGEKLPVIGYEVVLSQPQTTDGDE